MKVEINQTIDPEMVTLYSHRTGEFIDEIPAEKVKDMQHLSGGVFQVTRKQINKIKREAKQQDNDIPRV